MSYRALVTCTESHQTLYNHSWLSRSFRLKSQELCSSLCSEFRLCTRKLVEEEYCVTAQLLGMMIFLDHLDHVQLGDAHPSHQWASSLQGQ